MKQVGLILGRYWRIIRLVALFVFALVALMYLIPTERKFKYEYQKGKPWMHNDLMAPISFPIYKTPMELQAEKDSLLKGFVPFFLFDEEIPETELVELSAGLSDWWKGQQKKPDFARMNNKSMKRHQAFVDSLHRRSAQILTQIYNQGVVATASLNEHGLTESDEIQVIRNNVLSRQSVSGMLNQKMAYELLVNNLETYIAHLNTKFRVSVQGVSQDINFNEYITENVFYDAKTTSIAHDELIGSISLSKGMVQRGERIISRGDLVDSHMFKILESLRREYETSTGGITGMRLVWVGKLILVLAYLSVIFLFLFNFRKEIIESSLKTSFILFLIISFVAIASLMEHFGANSYLLPLTILPIVIRTFYDDRVALFVNLITTLIIAFFVSNSFEFVLMNIFGGLVGIFSQTNSYRRSKLVFTAFNISLTYGLVFFALRLIQDGSVKNVEWMNFMWFGLNGLLVMVSYPLIFIFEKTFKFLSDATLMELSDTNQPLLRKLAEQAPGTFQHSLQVANLAEEAILKIGGNPLLVRAGALYHDIGKMSQAIYFTENQAPGFNPHNELEFEESARIIISHVEKGAELARKHVLPQPIIDFIVTHHGTTTVQYFYKSFLRKFPDQAVDLKKFSYPGPKPFSKETAVLMMADSTEAASRSLKDYTSQSISDLVENIINYQVVEEQFDEANITFRDITTIKKVFKEKLKTIYHARISYPK